MDHDLEDRLHLTRLLLRAGEELAAEAEPSALYAAGRHLAGRLHELAEDDGLWKALRRAGVDPTVEKGQLAMLPMINWVPILKALNYDEPPSIAFAAGQSTRLLKRAAESGDRVDWRALRDHLSWLSDRLGRELGEPWASKDDGAREWLKFHVGQAFSVVRRMDATQLLLDAAPDASDAAFAVAAALGVPPLAFGVIIGKLAVNLGISVTRNWSPRRVAPTPSRPR